MVKLTYFLIFLLLLHRFSNIMIGMGLKKRTFLARAQRDLNPRPTAPQAAILSKLNYEPTYRYLATVNYKFYSYLLLYFISPIPALSTKLTRDIPMRFWVISKEFQITSTYRAVI